MNLLKQFEHLDPQNQHTFEARDLELLIQTVGEGEGISAGEGEGLGPASRWRAAVPGWAGSARPAFLLENRVLGLCGGICCLHCRALRAVLGFTY